MSTNEPPPPQPAHASTTDCVLETAASTKNTLEIISHSTASPQPTSPPIAPPPQQQHQLQPSTATTTTTTATTTIPSSSPSSSSSPTADISAMTDEQRILFKEKSLNEIKQQCSTLIHELEGNNNPELIIKKHIRQLNKYNELKDLALQLISLIANQRKVKILDILNEMNLEIDNDDNDDTTTTTTTTTNKSNNDDDNETKNKQNSDEIVK
ncbi:hypothetical protein Cantr_05586 [Candida viswanathii]|uniref:Uncharacterized protein n=1 Tax=Candida viswanathii TaxID=5486 RepID=A0A367XPW0_9ASCO|nr:hypothetical protein Cantr_05586 [Candida viswanathii]